jgi:hypoxanthine phosphoribosyltransferase
MKRKVTFEELLRLCDKLSEEIKKLGSFQLVAVSRGGLIPGAIIAKKLGAPLNVLSIDGNGGVTALSR